MKFVLAFLVMAVPAIAHADCLLPASPAIPAASASDGEFRHARGAVTAYVVALDTYMSCMKAAAATLPPLPAMADYRAYAAALSLMQQAVDDYDAALAAHAGAGS